MTDVVAVEAEPLVTLDQAKQHLRVDHDDDDTLIQLYMNAAHGRALEYCNRCDWPAAERARAAFLAAVLLIIGDLYASRDSGGAGAVKIHPAAAALIDPYRLLRV